MNKCLPLGAAGFVAKKFQDGRLRSYFRTAKDELNLSNSAGVSQIEEMNAMLIKIHSLISTDGLPIYDSRVAGSAGGLIELYCRANNITGAGLPTTMVFPSTDERRRIGRCLDGCIVTDVIRYNSADIHTRWASASVNLGRLLRDVLIAQPALFAHFKDLPARMHALEASLFMIGADLRSFQPAFKKYSKANERWLDVLS